MSVIEKDVQEVKSGWRSFTKGKWSRKVDVNNFIASNIKPYEGNEEFLVGPTSNTTELWKIISQLSKEERERGGVWDVSQILSPQSLHMLQATLTKTRNKL